MIFLNFTQITVLFKYNGFSIDESSPTKPLQILPKAVRTRTYKGSLIGQLNIFIELCFFYDATTHVNTNKMEQ